VAAATDYSSDQALQVFACAPDIEPDIVNQYAIQCLGQ
jgi:hypothetical protein